MRAVLTSRGAPAISHLEEPLLEVTPETCRWCFVAPKPGERQRPHRSKAWRSAHRGARHAAMPTGDAGPRPLRSPTSSSCSSQASSEPEP